MKMARYFWHILKDGINIATMYCERSGKGVLSIDNMGLLVGPVNIAKNEFIRMPRKECWGILVSKNSELALRERVTPADLARTPLLIGKRHLIQNELRGWFGPYFDSLEIVGTYNLLYNAAVMAENGVGTVLCMEHDKI